MQALCLSLFLIILQTVGALAGEPEPVIPSFNEETRSAGIDSSYTGDFFFFVGGGVATFDCNDDGYADMLLAGGESKAKFYRNASTKGGALKFEIQESGLELDRVSGTYPIDIDSDSITDLVLLRVGENVVMRGKGGCKFERNNENWGFNGGDDWSAAMAATWEHGSDWPTLAVGSYVNPKEELSPWGSCTSNWLHRPAIGAGKPQQRFSAPLALKPSFCALSMLFTDWNRSGTPSLRISNDREFYEGGQEQLWHVDPGAPPRLYTEQEGWKQLRIWGMGIASYDINSDTFPDYFLTSMADNKLQSLASPTGATVPQPAYGDIAYVKGVTAHRPYMGTDLKSSTAWHPQFEDVNNDGLVDLFISKGNVAKIEDFAAKDPNNLLLQNAEGEFVEVGDKAGVASTAKSRGAALEDFNLDGLLDLVVVNRLETAQLWRNTSAKAGNWIEFKLRQDAPNRDAIGSWIEVKLAGKILRREITIGGGHASGQLGLRHFGLGSASQAEVRVIWPDGNAGEWETLDNGGQYTLERGKPAAAWPEK
jgi:enediyne biosynthesis protein E4